jgi:hypothetical protein
MHPGTLKVDKASVWIRSLIMKAQLIRYVAATYLQIREREGHRDVEGHPVIHASVVKKPH